jgi:hypothetical protein
MSFSNNNGYTYPINPYSNNNPQGMIFGNVYSYTTPHRQMNFELNENESRNYREICLDNYTTIFIKDYFDKISKYDKEIIRLSGINIEENIKTRVFDLKLQMRTELLIAAIPRQITFHSKEIDESGGLNGFKKKLIIQQKIKDF